MIPSGTNPISALENKLKSFQMLIRQDWECECIVYVSSELEMLGELNRSYHGGRLHMRCYSDRCLIFQDMLEENENVTDLNLMENVMLTNLILDGQEKAAVGLIDAQWNKANQIHEYSLLEQMFFMQTAVLNNIAMKLGSRIQAETLESLDTATEMKRKVLSFAHELCTLAIENKEKRKNDVSEQIVEYIEAHFSEADFYIGTCAEAFCISEKSVSRLLKIRLDQTFAKYLEQLRMQKATELLENTDMDIENVAVACGFSTVNTFFKVFKRVYGVSPTTYRTNRKIGG